MLNTDLEFPREKRRKRRGKEEKGKEERQKKEIPSSAWNPRLHTFVRSDTRTNCPADVQQEEERRGGREREREGSDKTRRIENHGFDRP